MPSITPYLTLWWVKTMVPASFALGDGRNSQSKVSNASKCAVNDRFSVLKTVRFAHFLRRGAVGCDVGVQSAGGGRKWGKSVYAVQEVGEGFFP
ncbi:hypothetical protein, partial [Gordonia otitidis]